MRLTYLLHSLIIINEGRPQVFDAHTDRVLSALKLGGRIMSKKSLLTRIRNRWKDNQGQSTTEYILILAIVVMIASKMRTKLTSTVEGTMSTVDKQINEFNNP